jgi:hypothetical protein
MAQIEIITLKCAQYWFQIVLLYVGTHLILREDITEKPIKTMQYAHIISISRENKQQVLSILSYPTLPTVCKVSINQPKPITRKAKSKESIYFIKTKYVPNKNSKYTTKYFKKIS